MDGPFLIAIDLIASGDPALTETIALSLKVTLTAVSIGCLIGLPLGAGLALARFPGRGAIVVAFNALMGLPPVVAGLLVYLMLSRSGPLGDLALLFTPTAMVIAQTILILRGGRGISDQLISSGLLMKDRREDGKTEALFS